MAKCSACGKNYDSTIPLELVRNQDNHWVAICRSCMEQGVDIEKVVPPNIAVEDAALEAADTPAVDVTLAKDPLDNAKNLLESLKNLRQSKERAGRARAHERRAVELIVYYTLARDDTRHEGIVKDFSQSGLRVTTDHQLTKGQIVQFDWNVPLPPAMARMLQNSAEVKRVVKNESDTYDVGLHFLTRAVDKGANRRRYRRYKCNMVTYYRRKGSELYTMGKVTDISQGGCQMQLGESMDSGEVFTVRLIGGGGAKGDLVGTMRVCRVVPREVDFETGCAFEQMRMEAQPNLDGSPAAPIV